MFVADLCSLPGRSTVTGKQLENSAQIHYVGTITRQRPASMAAGRI